MPIYEYKCPNGHLFEVFHGMTEPGPEKCEVCGASPLVVVLHPVAVHYKGSGFYTTDYGRKSKAATKEGSGSGSSSGSDSSGGSGESGGGDGGSSSSSSGDGKKAAEA
jgi:putative FmdB family regulatory protein